MTSLDVTGKMGEASQSKPVSVASSSIIGAFVRAGPCDHHAIGVVKCAAAATAAGEEL